MTGKRVLYLYTLFDEFNKEEFGGKLSAVRLLMKRTCSADGYYEYRADRDWCPLREPEDASIVIGDHCWKDEDLLQGTLLHEMIHQYQVEILKRKPNHDAIFTSIAKRLERKYGFSVR